MAVRVYSLFLRKKSTKKDRRKNSSVCYYMCHKDYLLNFSINKLIHITKYYLDEEFSFTPLYNNFQKSNHYEFNLWLNAYDFHKLYEPHKFVSKLKWKPYILCTVILTNNTPRTIKCSQNYFGDNYIYFLEFIN